ncbi:hypothetical protein [Roseiconus lacunae]|uniref:hypothetical protein n=1 Tax=Roseiconus lacunae TaxID=2605694 RepID=UPI0011F2BAB6
MNHTYYLENQACVTASTFNLWVTVLAASLSCFIQYRGGFGYYWTLVLNLDKAFDLFRYSCRSCLDRRSGSVLRILLFLFGFVCSTHVSAAPTVVFDFETPELPGTGNINVPTFGPVSFTEQGVTMTITHENDVEFAYNRRTSTAFTSRFGFQAFSAFGDSGGSSRFDPGAFLLDFDTVITSISVDMGDFGVEADDLLVEAYSGLGATGTLIGTGTGFVPDVSGFRFDTVTVSGEGIRSVRMIGGSESIPNSVFYDNITVTLSAIPEPSGALFFAALLCGTTLLRRRG